MDDAKLTANKEAKRIVIQSIQRVATETAIENSVTVFHIESGFHSTPPYYLPFVVTPHRSPLWYNPSLIYCLPKGKRI